MRLLKEKSFIYSQTTEEINSRSPKHINKNKKNYGKNEKNILL